MADVRITGPDGGFVTEFLSDKPYVTAHTSGSTGEPKPIRLLKSDMSASAMATCRFFGIEAGSNLVCPLSTEYIAGKMMVVRALVSGASLTLLQPSSNPLAALPNDYDAAIDLLPVVPSQIPALIGDAGGCSLVRNLLVGGAPLDAATERRLVGLGINAYVGYGMTETCSHVALRRVGSLLYEAMPQVSFEVDSRGCLVVNTSRLSVGRIVTNDVVRLVDSARFEWLGRFDNVINSGGVKIHPEIDERALAAELPAGCEFYISSRSSDRWGREAVIVWLAGCLTDDEIMAACRRALPHTHCPKAIVRDSNPTYTSSGKLIRRR